MIELPKGIVKASVQNPKNLIIFGLPKIGKTTALSTLPNSLLVDLENGSDYISGVKVKVNSIKEINELRKAIKEAGNPYEFIIVDTVTALEEMAKPLALKMLLESPAGTNFTGNDPTQAPNGLGWGLMRQALQKLIDIFAQCAKNVILVGHVKDKNIVDTDGNITANIKELDLAGKTGRILAAKSDAIAFCHRDKDGNLCLNFATSDDISVGARPEHLRGQDIVIAEKQSDGTFTSHWERVFPSLNK